MTEQRIWYTVTALVVILGICSTIYIWTVPLI
jgi:hypothetical protein